MIPEVIAKLEQFWNLEACSYLGLSKKITKADVYKKQPKSTRKKKKSHRDLISSLLLIYFLIVSFTLINSSDQKGSIWFSSCTYFYQNHEELIGWMNTSSLPSSLRGLDEARFCLQKGDTQTRPSATESFFVTHITVPPHQEFSICFLKVGMFYRPTNACFFQGKLDVKPEAVKLVQPFHFDIPNQTNYCTCNNPAGRLRLACKLVQLKTVSQESLL